MKNIILIISVLFVFEAHEVFASESFDLKLNLKQGDVYIMRQTTDQNIHQTVFGSQYTIHQSSMNESRMKIEEVDDQGNMIISTVLERVKLNQNANGVETTYDSADPANSSKDLSALYNAMLGKEMTMTLSPKGNLLDMEGVGQLFDNLMNNEKYQEAAGTPQVQELKESMGDESMKNMLKDIYGYFPDKPIAVGSSWSRQNTMTMPLFSMIIDSTYTVLSRKDGKVKIKESSIISTGPAGNAMEFEAGKMSYKINDGKQSSIMTIDEKSGWMLKAESTQSMDSIAELEMNIPEEQKYPELYENVKNMKTQMNMESTTLIEVKKVEDEK